MPSRRKETGNKLHAIRSHEKQFSEGVSGVTSYFTPSLVEICAKVVADTFPDQPRIEATLRTRNSSLSKDELQGNSSGSDPSDGLRSGEQLLQLVTYQLSTDLPLDVCVRRVTAEEYWRARCEARWSPQSGQLPAFIKYKNDRQVGDELSAVQNVSKPEPDWKRTYLERHLEEFMMTLSDEDNDLSELPDEAAQQARLEDLYQQSKLTYDKIQGLQPMDIFEQLCRLAPEKILELNLDRQRAHLDWVQVFSWLPNLWNFRVTFAVLNAGMNFRLSMFGIRKADIVGPDHDKDIPPRGLVKVLRDPKCYLQRLSLPENQIDDEKTKGLLLGLIKNETVEVLDLSHNKISDEGAKALATLLIKQSREQSEGRRILELNLTDNLVGVGGGKALGRALTLNNTLENLSLRLNRLTDEGGAPIIAGLKNNSSLRKLNLSNNELGCESTEALADTLKANGTLEELHLTGNLIGEEGGKVLLHAARGNQSLTLLDVRAGGVTQQDIDEINSILKQRVDLKKRSLEAEKEKILREETGYAVKDWRDRFYLGE